MTDETTERSLSYRDAGVDIDAGEHTTCSRDSPAAARPSSTA